MEKKVYKKNKFKEIYEKHFVSLLPNSIYADNILVDNFYYMNENNYKQLEVINNNINEYIDYYLSNVKKIIRELDNELEYYYGNEIDAHYLIENIDYKKEDMLFSRLDVAQDLEGQFKVFEINTNKPSTFSEQIYSDLKTGSTILKDRLNSFFSSYQKPTNIAIIIDSFNSESVSTFYALKELIENNNINLISLEMRNIVIDGDNIYGYDKDFLIDQVIYFYPIEYLYKGKTYQTMLKLYKERKLLIYSSPLNILVQNKGFFAITTELINKNLLPQDILNKIKLLMPKTYMLDSSSIKGVIENKDEYIFKPINGRLSQGIVIGKGHKSHTIDTFLKDNLRLNHKYIVQELVEIQKEQVRHIEFNVPKYKEAYIVFGIFSINYEYIHSVTRISQRIITSDISWSLPIKSISQYKQNVIVDNQDVGLTLKEKVDFNVKLTYNGFMLDDSEYLSKQYIELEESVYDKIKFITTMFMDILYKTQNYIINNYHIFNDTLKVDENYFNNESSIFSIISRVDVIITDTNEIKILEANVETPAGLYETFYLTEHLINSKKNDIKKVNLENRNKIKETLFKRLKEIPHTSCIGVMRHDYYEDIYNVHLIEDLLNEISQDYYEGNLQVVSFDLKNAYIEEDKLYAKGYEINTMFRYFPLDWLDFYQQNPTLLKGISRLFKENKLYSLTPNNTIVSQNKKIYALIYDILEADVLYNMNEKMFIKEYLPFSSLNKDYFFKNIKDVPYLTKRTFGREGKGIYVNRKYEEDSIYQEMYNIKTMNIKRKMLDKIENIYVGYPVYGIYFTDREFCGIFTRVGNRITNSESYYLPTFKK